MTRLYLRIWLAVAIAVVVVTMGVGLLVRTYYEGQLAEQRANAGPPTVPMREITLKDASGQVMASGVGRPTRIAPPAGEGRAPRPPGMDGPGGPGGPGGASWEYTLRGADGQAYSITIGPRMRTDLGVRQNSPDAPPKAPTEMRRDPRPLGASGPGGPGFGRPPPAAMALPPFAREPWGMLFLVLTVGVAVALGAYPVVRKLTQRLERLKSGVQRFGQGELATRVEVVGKDEIAYLTQQFNESGARIEALVSSHKTLLANASHELRSPLARLRMGMELAQLAPTEALYAEMRRSIAELDQLIEEILLASRLDATSSSGQINEPVDMLGILAEECAHTGAVLQADADAAAVLQGDGRLLRRLVRNLLENAKRYGGSGEVTATWAAQAPHAAVLLVCDHGPGVPAVESDRIFEPFYRAKGASEASGGVGLGLALVKGIAQRHQAQVACKPRSDGQAGACFEVRFG